MSSGDGGGMAVCGAKIVLAGIGVGDSNNAREVVAALVRGRGGAAIARRNPEEIK